MSFIEPQLDDNVVLSSPVLYPTLGKTDVMETLGEWVADKETQVSLSPTDRFGMVTEIAYPNRKKIICRLTFYILTDSAGKIIRIARQPIVWDEYCFGVGNFSPFTWEEIEPCLNDVEVRRIMRGHMFCPQCGKLSHELTWINFQSKPDPISGLSYYGKMSVCPDCKQEVEFLCEGTLHVM